MDRAYPERNWQEQYTKFGSYEHEVARGNVRGAYPFSTYGRVEIPGAATNIMVQCQDGTDIVVPQGVQMSVASTSADDTVNGTGVRTIVIEYLNGNLDSSFEILALNGTTPVLTQATDIRWVQSIYAATFGSYRKAVGQIDVSNNGNVYARIKVDNRNSHSVFRRIPRNKRLLLTSLSAGSISGNAAAKTIIEVVTSSIDGLDQQETGFLYKIAGVGLQDGSQTRALPSPVAISQGTIIGIVATCDKGAAVTAGLIGWIEDAS